MICVLFPFFWKNQNKTNKKNRAFGQSTIIWGKKKKTLFQLSFSVSGQKKIFCLNQFFKWGKYNNLTYWFNKNETKTQNQHPSIHPSIHPLELIHTGAAGAAARAEYQTSLSPATSGSSSGGILRRSHASRDIIPAACPVSALGPLCGWTCLKQHPLQGGVQEAS